MADLSQHANYTGKYSGLLDNLWLTLAIGGVCLVGYEIEIRVPRRRGWQGSKQWSGLRIWRAGKRAWVDLRRYGRDNRHVESKDHEIETKSASAQGGGEKDEDPERRRLGDREAWEFGYIYQSKAWSFNRSKPVPKWPLQWIWTSLRIKEADMPPIWGCDLTLHARFLRGSLFYIFIQVLVIMPVLMPLHILYSPDTIAKTSMIRASVSSLVETTGDKWLWVHSILIWWSSILWLSTALWIVWGGIGYRKREVERLRARQRMQAKEVDEDPEGAKRFRSLMVLNIPPDMRDEDILREYFDHNLQRHRARTNRSMITMTGAMKEVNKAFIRPALMLARNNNSREMFSRVGSAIGLSDRRDSADLRNGNSGSGTPVTPAARSAGAEGEGKPLSKERSNDAPRSALPRDDDVEEEDGDVEEVILVRKLGSLISLRERRGKVLKDLELAHVALARRILAAVKKHKKHHPQAAGATVTPADSTSFTGISRKQRLDILTKELGQFVDDEPEQLGHSQETVWEVLHRLPKVLTDPYQALTHLPITAPFRKSNAPVIDYLTTKLAYLTMLLDKARSQPLEDFASSSAAFVVFKDARTARFALKVLDNHPTRTLACHTHAAPNWVELLWPRLGTSVYRSGFVRGWVVFLGVWAFTLAWVFPVSLFCALTSLSNIAGFIPPLADWLAKNPKASSAITSLAPVILVALLTIAICPILLVIANRTEHIVTRLGIHNSVLERFWKFLMVNGVVFFAIGQSAIEAYLTAFKAANFDPLPIVASAFPTAAPYFASYILLQTAIQPCFEIFRFGLPAIVYWFGTRWSKIPRQRWSRTEHPTFSHFSQLPYQLLAVAISNLFMLLNPLVLPFALVYYTCCYVVWKRQFMFVYGRLYENNGRRSCVRIFRYSLDALALAQFALFAFFILNKAKGSAISTGCLFFITLGIKLVLTRAIKQRFDNLEIEEADIICPPAPSKLPVPQVCRLSESFDDEDADEPTSSFRVKSRFQTWRQHVARKIRHYAYAGVVVPVGYVKPIPFDHFFLAWLDRYFTYPMTPYPDQPAAALPVDPAAGAITAELVVPHTKLAPWEDIPPFQRSRAYWDQPAYTDPYDDFLWLPRDPLSTLDLDDTIEMRASLTTSRGGSGRFAYVGEVDEIGECIEVEDDREVVVHSPTPRPSEEDHRPSISPMSDHRLLGILDDREPLPSPPLFTPSSQVNDGIGSEVDRGPAGTLRKNTIRFADGLQDVFRRPRAQSRVSDESDVVTMRTLSRASMSSLRVVPTTSQVSRPVVESPEEELVSSAGDGLLTARPSQSRLPSSGSFQGAGSPILRPADLPAPDLNGPRSPTGSGSASRISFNPADLGRSPSRRRPTPPHLVRNPSQMGSSFGMPVRRPSVALSPRPALSPGLPGLGTASIRSGVDHQRERSSSTLSAEQAALWREVMEEERIASLSAQEAERAHQEAEREELRKERERDGYSGPFVQGGATMGRAASISISNDAQTTGMQRSATVAPGASADGSRIRRRGTLAGVGRIVIAANRVSSANRSRPETAAVHIQRDRARSVSSTNNPNAPVTAPLPAVSASVPIVRPGHASTDSLAEASASTGAQGEGNPQSAGLQRGKTVIERMREQSVGAPQSNPQPERAGAGPTGIAATSGWGI